MFETIKLEARHLARDMPEMTAGLDLTFFTDNPDGANFTGNVFELACLVERHETGNWSIPLDEIEAGHDHVRAAQRIDQYTI